FALDRRDVDAGACGNGARAVARRRRLGPVFMPVVEPRIVQPRIVQPIARAADGEAFLVEQLADAPDEEDFVVLVIAPVAAPLHRLELRELLLPVAQHVRLHPAQLAHLTDGEVALGGDRREFSFPAALLHGAPSRPWPSVSGWRGRSRRDAR